MEASSVSNVNLLRRTESFNVRVTNFLNINYAIKNAIILFNKLFLPLCLSFYFYLLILVMQLLYNYFFIFVRYLFCIILFILWGEGLPWK